MFRHRDDSPEGSRLRLRAGRASCPDCGRMPDTPQHEVGGCGWPSALPRGWSAVEPVGEPVAAFAARCMHDGVDIVIRGVSRSAVWAAAMTYERGLGRRG